MNFTSRNLDKSKGKHNADQETAGARGGFDLFGIKSLSWACETSSFNGNFISAK